MLVQKRHVGPRLQPPSMLARNRIVRHRARQHRIEKARGSVGGDLLEADPRCAGNWTSTTGSTEQRPTQPTLTTSALISRRSRYSVNGGQRLLTAGPESAGSGTDEDRGVRHAIACGTTRRRCCRATPESADGALRSRRAVRQLRRRHAASPFYDKNRDFPHGLARHAGLKLPVDADHRRQPARADAGHDLQAELAVAGGLAGVDLELRVSPRRRWRPSLSRGKRCRGTPERDCVPAAESETGCRTSPRRRFCSPAAASGGRSGRRRPALQEALGLGHLLEDRKSARCASVRMAPKHRPNVSRHLVPLLPVTNAMEWARHSEKQELCHRRSDAIVRGPWVSPAGRGTEHAPTTSVLWN